MNSRLFSCTSEKVSSESSSKESLRRDSSTAGSKMASAERLRPIGASAEDEACESVGKFSTDSEEQGSSGERSVHIVIKPDEDTDREDSEEPTKS